MTCVTLVNSSLKSSDVFPPSGSALIFFIHITPFAKEMKQNSNNQISPQSLIISLQETGRTISVPSFKKKKKNFIYLFRLHWVLVAARRFGSLTACGILVPQPGIKPTSPASEGQFLALDYQGSPSVPSFL